MLFNTNMTWISCVLWCFISNCMWSNLFNSMPLATETTDVLLDNIFHSCFMHEKSMLWSQITLWCEQTWGELEILLKSACFIWNKHSWPNTLRKKSPKYQFLLSKRKIYLENSPREIKNEIYVFICSYMKHIIQSEEG